LIIRKPGERYCPDCIDHVTKQDPEDINRRHCWGAVGYNFKSKLVFYNVPTNKNGKLTKAVYLNDILKTEVQRWLDEGDTHFILEEDNDSGHGTAKGGGQELKSWKAEKGIELLPNCPRSPDLSIIENVWNHMKQSMEDKYYYSNEELEDAIQRAWNAVPQSWIDKLVDDYFERLEDVLHPDVNGKMTAY